MKRRCRLVTVWLLVTALLHGQWLAAPAAANEGAVLPKAGVPAVKQAKPRPAGKALQLLAQSASAGSSDGVTADIGYVPPSATAAVVLHPRRVLTAPEFELLPLEVISAAGKQQFGLDPLEIEWAVGVAEVTGFGPPQVGLILRSSSPLDDSQLLMPLKRDAEKQTLDGRPYYRSRIPSLTPSIFLPDDHSVIVAHEGLLQKMLKNHQDPQPGKVSRIIRGMERLPDAALAMDFEPLRPLVSGLMLQNPPPPTLAALQDIPALVAEVEARADLTGKSFLYLAVRANNDADALKLQNIVSAMLQEVKGRLAKEIDRHAESEDPVERAMAQYLQRITDRYFGAIQPDRKGDTLYKRLDGGQESQMAAIGILVALLLPSVSSAREAARRSQSVNNLKQLGLAMHNYHDVYRRFPTRAIFDSEGRPLLSWRVQILPFIEEQDLYEQFHLDEPWDSEHNKALIPQMPEVYRNPSALAEPGLAHYVALVGPGTLFEGREARSFRDILDGSSNSIMLVEVNSDRAVIWTKPEDLPFDPENPLDGLGNAHPGGFNVLFCDGSVRFISETIDREVFRRMATIADGKPLGDL